jgi:Zn-dependent peptidase ImmA (M78 family)
MTLDERRVIARHITEAPVDITALCTDLGVAVFESYDLPAGISGKICLDPGSDSSSGYSITVNANEPYRRRRFTVAHECAHFLLHRAKIGDELTDDALYRSEKLNTQEEFEANNQAAELLMPRKLMNEYIGTGLSSISYLANAFDVSEPAMKVRMRYLYQLEYA